MSTLSIQQQQQQHTDRFGAMELSPRTRDPLIVPGSSALEAMSSPCMAISIRVVAAVGLRAMHKGLTSHPMVEVSLVHDDGSVSPANAWNMGNDLKNGSRTPGSASAAARGSGGAGGAGGGHHTRPLRSQVVKSSLNPIWNFDVDFGDVDRESVVGVLFVVRHVEKLGMVKKDMGELMLSLREVMDLKMQPPHEQEFHLQPTREMATREIAEGPTNRKYGKLTVRFNGYGVTSTTTAPSSYTMMTEARLSNMSAAVAHEDDFARSSKSIVVHDIKAEVKTLQAYHQTRPAAGEVWYAISTPWIQNWLLFVSKYKGDEARNPGQIDNMALIADDLSNGTFQLRSDLEIKTHFRVINKKSWDYYQLVYGGGPAIEIHVPATCENPSKWIANVRLEDVARVGTNYVDSDSD